MATIRKLTGQKGITYKAIIKDTAGNHLKSKNFTRLGDTKIWISRIEADDEHMEALGMHGASMTFSQLLDESYSSGKGAILTKSIVWNTGERNLVPISFSTFSRHCCGKNSKNFTQENARAAMEPSVQNP